QSHWAITSPGPAGAELSSISRPPCDNLSQGRQGCDAVADFHEAVADERLDGLVVELLQRAGALRDEAQRPRPALAKRPLQRPLLAPRLVAAAEGRAPRRQRAVVAARDPGQTNLPAEIEERLGALVVEVTA